MFVMTLPSVIAFTVPEIVSIPLSPVARSKPVQLSVVVLYVPTDVVNVIPVRSPGIGSLIVIPTRFALPSLSALTV